MSTTRSPAPHLPGFTFIRAIGAGGFADVFSYRQHSTDREVAVKVLRSEHLSEVSLRQFQAEANIMAGVSAHPYIVTIHDAGVAPDGRPFIVMEHYPNPHFGIRARSARMPIAEVLKTAVQICAAVETAHRAKILHRDIKPSNILTSAYGDPGLTDFGIAGVQRDDEMTAASGISLGYSAPELMLHEDHPGSVQSDVYSLAATIYALAAGRSPIHDPSGGNTAVLLQKRAISGEVGPTGRADVPRQLEHLLRAGLALAPEVRPTSAAALGRALQDIEQSSSLPPTPLVVLDDSIVDAGPAPMAEPTRMPPSRIDPDAPGPPEARTGASSLRPPTSAGAGPTGTPAVPRVPVVGRRVTMPPTSASPSGSVHGVRPPAYREAPRASEPDRPEIIPLEPETVAREAPAGSSSPRGPIAPSRTASDEPSSSVGRNLAIGAAAAIALLSIVAVFVMLPSGGGEEEVPTTNRRATPDPVVTDVPAPTDVRVEVPSDRSATVSWKRPNFDGPIEFRVYRSIDGAEEILAEDLDLVDVEILELDPEVAGDPPLEPDEDGLICVTVYALAGGRISDPSPPTCAEPTG